jgi:hypothetical protein
MKYRDRVQSFISELELLLSGKSDSRPTDLPLEDRQALGLAQALGQVDFSTESRQKAALYSRLLAQATAPDFKPAPQRKSRGIPWAELKRATAWAALGLFLVIVLVWGINNLIPGFGEDPARDTEIPVVSTQATQTPHPTETAEPAATRTPTADPLEGAYCQKLSEGYQPNAGYKLYCDPSYEFALEVPEDWRKIGLSFHSADSTNFIRIDPYRALMPLEKAVEAHYAYEYREFPEKKYPLMTIGGKPAYGFVNAWVHYISGALIFFQHEDYYFSIELPAYSKDRLDVNWEIVRSLQFPGTSPDDNVIPDEFIADSYLLLELSPVTIEPPTETPPAPTATPEPAVAPVREFDDGFRIIGYLTCNQLKSYDWVWSWASSDEYYSLTPIFGVDQPYIFWYEVIEVCPEFSIRPAVYAYDEWEVIGFLTCSELEQYDWVWTTREVGWYYSTTPLFGEEKPRINIHYGWSCPGFSPQPPVRDPESHEIIGFLTCSQMAEYEWVEIPDGSGYYESTTPIFGVESPVIMRQEVFLLCNFPAP